MKRVPGYFSLAQRMCSCAQRCSFGATYQWYDALTDWLRVLKTNRGCLISVWVEKCVAAIAVVTVRLHSIKWSSSTCSSNFMGTSSLDTRTNRGCLRTRFANEDADVMAVGSVGLHSIKLSFTTGSSTSFLPPSE